MEDTVTRTLLSDFLLLSNLLAILFLVLAVYFWRLTKKESRLLKAEVGKHKNLAAQFRAIIMLAKDAIIASDSSGKIVFWNQAAVDTFGYSQKEALGKFVNDLVFPAWNKEEKTGAAPLLGKTLEITAVKKNGAEFPSEITVTAIKSRNKLEVAGQVWSFRNVAERVMLQEQIEYQATHDLLTGLPNRVLLNDRIHQAIAISKRNNTIFGVLFFDIDRFKLVNDGLSLSAGDELLQKIAERIKLLTRESDTIARLGGDEFVGVLVLGQDDSALLTVANKLLSVFQKPFKVADSDVTVSVSVGISFFPRNGQTPDELLRNADIAMHRAKETGGNQLQFYSPDVNANHIERLHLETDLHHALENNEFYLCYQPQIDITNNQMVSVEALIRWKHPEKGLILPNDFIPIAEQAGIIVPIGAWVLREACQQNKKWQEQGLPPIRVTVNISTNQFKHPQFVETVKNILEETQLEPDFLELELTENLLIKMVDAKKTIMDLKNLGVRIALDDFGTGYSSLGYLRHLKIDRLKIDQSYVKNINSDSDDEVIIKAIISIARDLNLQVVAEGVETQKQLDFLRSKHCEEIQGYFFSKPIIAEEIEIMLKKPRIEKD